jgi:phospholipase/carboxylesterase
VREEELEIAGLRVVSVGEPDAAEQVVLLLHGFQMTPRDLSPFAHSLRTPAWFLFPEAPLAADQTGRAWWRIDANQRDEALRKGPRDFAEQHPPDLAAARAQLLALVEALSPRVGARPFVIGGFSQGAMLTCDTVLRSSFALSAMVLLSGSRIAFDEWQPLLPSGRLRGLPTLLAHGERDADLAFTAGTALRDCLIAAGASVTWQPFEQGHQIPLVAWRTLKKFLASAPRTTGASAPSPREA